MMLSLFFSMLGHVKQSMFMANPSQQRKRGRKKKVDTMVKEKKPLKSQTIAVTVVNENCRHSERLLLERVLRESLLDSVSAEERPLNSAETNRKRTSSVLSALKESTNIVEDVVGGSAETII